MNIKIEEKQKGRISNSFFNTLATNKRYILIVIIEITLFFLYYYIVSPSNFSSFSDTLRYFISALGTLLAVVVSFNTLALQNQLKNMPTNISSLNKQLDEIEDILKPVLDKSRDNIQKTYHKLFENSTLYFTDAMESLIIVAKDQAQKIAMNSIKNKNNNNRIERENNDEEELLNLTNKFIKEADYRLSLYNKNKTPYNLISISTPYFVEKMRFSFTIHKNEETYCFSETIKRLQVLKGICQRIYIRDALAMISYELLISAIPIIAFIAAIASISNYNQYDIFFIRILFAVSLSAATLPFILLLIRNLPVLHLIRSSSTIPFTRKNT